MRTVHLADDLRLRFPGREDEFTEGVEVGMIAALMSLGHSQITRTLSPECLEQVEGVARKLRYHLAERSPEEAGVRVTFRAGRARPRLALVHCRPERGIEAAAR